MSFPTDLEIALNADIKHIREIADKIGIDREDLEYYGKYKAKIPLKYIDEEKIKNSKLILVSAINPTPAGEGKTTVSVGLSDGPFLYRKNKQYRGKNDLLQKNNQQLEKVNQDLSQHYACLQEEITQRDLEIENLRKELASCRIDEEQREKIRVELDEMVLRRKALVKEAFLHSPLYAKMQAIIKDHLDKDASDKEISDQEWQELIVSMDSQWNNAISRFHVKYQLSKEELYLVCLSLTDFPFAHLAYLMHSSRRTLYRKKNALCERIGVEQNSEFKEILRKI